MADNIDLTIDEMRQIVKAVAGWNSGKLEFHTGYLKYADELTMTVTRPEPDQVLIRVSLEPKYHKAR